MWLWLLIPLTISFNGSPWISFWISSATAAKTSVGPTYPAEAELLWKNGQKDFEQAKYQDAVNDLQRLVDRYPGYEGFLEAHRLLGRSLMLLGRNEDAVKPLKHYIAATGNRDLGLRTRLWLGEDYLLMSEPHEAYLTAIEVENATKKSGQSPYAESQLLKAHALIGLNQDERADRVLDSVESNAAFRADETLKAADAQTRITLKLRSCAKYPAAGKMDEDQARDQFARRGLCLQEALVLFKGTVDSREPAVTEQADHEISDAYASYGQATKNPPEPPKMKPASRTAVQNQRYRAELVDRLEQDRKKTIQDALSTLSQWKGKPYDKLSKEIGALL